MRFLFHYLIFFALSDSRYSNSCISAKYSPIPTNHITSMESLYIQLIYWWFCGPGSQMTQFTPVSLILLYYCRCHCLPQCSRTSVTFDHIWNTRVQHVGLEHIWFEYLIKCQVCAMWNSKRAFVRRWHSGCWFPLNFPFEKLWMVSCASFLVFS